MAITLAPSLTGEDTFELKLLNKSLAYLLMPGADAGEMHEINTLFHAGRGNLTVDGRPCTINDETYFSRGRWTPTRGLDFISINDLNMYLPPALNRDAKVKNGDNEIDLIMMTGNRQVIIECKSGGASSSGSQTNSYVESLLERGSTGTPSYFAYCYDSSVSEKSYFAFFHKIFKTISETRQSIYPAATVFFKNFTYNNTGTPESDIGSIIHQHITTNNITSTYDSDYARINLLNEILDTHAGFKLHQFYVPRSSKSNIRDATIKLINKNYLTSYPGSRPPPFWLTLKLTLEKARL